MEISRRGFVAGSAVLLGQPALAQSQEPSIDLVLAALLGQEPDAFFSALNFIVRRGGTDLVLGLIFAMRFSRAPATNFDQVLQLLTGEERSGWFDWMLWQEAHPEVISHPAYYIFKRELLLRIDPAFDVFLDPEHIAPGAMKIRFEELTWGGVRKDGIPSLDYPRLLSASEADYLQPDDLVFGVAINGDVRAYPLRIMGWHEMFNEVIGGVPVALAYCTLCGAGILFETGLEGRADPLIFGSSGFLYRSNKLMFDRETHSLWNQFTGKPVSGALVDSGIELKQRPVVITEWESWRTANPETKVITVEPGFLRDYGSGVVYKDYFASDDLMFPAQVDERALRQKDYVFGIRAPGGAKAWPLTAFGGVRVINDQVGFQNVVLIGDAAGRTVRAYDRGDLEFGSDLTAGGVAWTATEDALLADDGRRAERVAGHVAYWFAWNGYLGAEAELYGQ